MNVLEVKKNIIHMGNIYRIPFDCMVREYYAITRNKISYLILR